MLPNADKPIVLVKACACFIPMNPVCAKVIPVFENFQRTSRYGSDGRVKITVKLASIGCSTFVPSAKKFCVLYQLCEELFSKQHHNDFGLRNILSVLKNAGNSKRQEPPSSDEEMIMASTKSQLERYELVAQSIPLLLRDTFPARTDIEQKTYQVIEGAIRKLIR
jgi:dynein heavy chain